MNKNRVAPLYIWAQPFFSCCLHIIYIFVIDYFFEVFCILNIVDGFSLFCAIAISGKLGICKTIASMAATLPSDGIEVRKHINYHKLS